MNEKKTLDGTFCLQKLRIPAGWLIKHNSFFNISPIFYNVGDNWRFFEEDLLQLEYRKNGFLLDLGWYPATVQNGQYSLSLIKDENWENPVLEFFSRSKDEIVEKINEVLLDISEDRVRF